MPAVTLRSLRPDVAAQLNRLEMGAAVLERDARNSHAALVELGFDFPVARSPFLGLVKARSRALRILGATWGAARATVGWVDRAARSPRTATALRITYRTAREGVACVLLAFALLIPMALAIIVLAPPV